MADRFVFKLGGSLNHAAELPCWLAALATHGKGRAVVVPGGGEFADQVRLTQQHWHFDDAVAHRMALLAMAQTAWLYEGLCHDVTGAETLLQLEQQLADGRNLPVWRPFNLLAGDKSVPENWCMTSDSLAAWLALKLQATQLVLVKSACPDSATADVKQLVRQGMVDNALPGQVQSATFKTWIVHCAMHTSVAQMLNDSHTASAGWCSVYVK